MTIDELKKYFDSQNLDRELQLTDNIMILNLKSFVTGHLNYIINQAGKKAYLPYYNRLIQIKQILDAGTDRQG